MPGGGPVGTVIISQHDTCRTVAPMICAPDRYAADIGHPVEPLKTVVDRRRAGPGAGIAGQRLADRRVDIVDRRRNGILCRRSSRRGSTTKRAPAIDTTAPASIS